VFAKRLGELMRHPLVVGVGLAVLSAIFASILVPGLTRVWQDRPKELALKRSLVEQITKSATQALQVGESTALPTKSPSAHPEKPDTEFIELRATWEVNSSLVNAELTTYFRDKRILGQWREFSDAVINYLDAASHDNYKPKDKNGGFYRLFRHFKRHKLKADSRAEGLRKRFVAKEGGSLRGIDDCRPLFCAARLLAAERDELPRTIVDAHAAGFSQGWWIFK
jgi:hypothetical protein